MSVGCVPHEAASSERMPLRALLVPHAPLHAAAHSAPRRAAAALPPRPPPHLLSGLELLAHALDCAQRLLHKVLAGAALDVLHVAAHGRGELFLAAAAGHAKLRGCDVPVVVRAFFKGVGRGRGRLAAGGGAVPGPLVLPTCAVAPAAARIIRQATRCHTGRAIAAGSAGTSCPGPAIWLREACRRCRQGRPRRGRTRRTVYGKTQ